MDIWEYYGEVQRLTEVLRAQGQDDLVSQIEAAMRGGTTSGEIMGGLSVVLPLVSEAVPGLATEAEALARWARDAIS